MPKPGWGWGRVHQVGACAYQQASVQQLKKKKKENRTHPTHPPTQGILLPSASRPRVVVYVVCNTRTHTHVSVPQFVVVSCCDDCHALAREGGRQVAGGGMCVTDRELLGTAKSGCP